MSNFSAHAWLASHMEKSPFYSHISHYLMSNSSTLHLISSPLDMDLISAFLGLSQHFCSGLRSPVMIKTLPECKSLHVAGVKVGQVTVNPLPINLRHILHTGRSWHSHNTRRGNGVPMMPGGHKSQRKEVATEWQKVATACCLQLLVSESSVVVLIHVSDNGGEWSGGASWPML